MRLVIGDVWHVKYHETMTLVAQLELWDVVMLDMLCANGVGIQGPQIELDVMTAK